jgi:hypothetical protein
MCTYGKHHQDSNHRWLTDEKGLPKPVTRRWIGWIFHQTDEVREHGLHFVNGVRLFRIQVNEDHRKEDDVDQDEYDNGNASPLEPYNFADTAIDSPG